MSLAKKNVAEFNDDVKSNDGYLYSTNPPLSSVLANDRIAAALNKHIAACRTLVDIGCGDGVYTAGIKKKFPHLMVEGFDPAEDAIAIASGKYPNILFKVINILQEDIGRHVGSFDVGVLRGVLHHLSDQELAIRHSLAIAPTVVIVEPNGNNPILKIIEKVSPYHRAHEEQSFSSRQLRTWCRKAGGEVVAQEYIGFVPFFFPEWSAKIVHVLQPLLEKVPLIREFFSAQIVLVCKRSRTSVQHGEY